MKKFVFGCCFALTLGFLIGNWVGRTSEVRLVEEVVDEEKEGYLSTRSESYKFRDGKQRSESTISRPVKPYDTLSAVSFLVEENPKLIERLNLAFFDEDLEIRENDWELLGINMETAERVRRKVDVIVSKIKQFEVESFEIVENSDDFLQLGLPPVPKEQRQYYLDQLSDAFEAAFPRKTAVLLGMRFLSQNSSMTGGVTGLARIISVTPNERTGGFNILTGVSSSNVTLEQLIENPEGHTSLNSQREVSELPTQWNHLLLKDK
jgi:hypothetical protein